MDVEGAGGGFASQFSQAKRETTEILGFQLVLVLEEDDAME
jgi:hypothetical protein